MSERLEIVDLPSVKWDGNFAGTLSLLNSSLLHVGPKRGQRLVYFLFSLTCFLQDTPDSNFQNQLNDLKEGENPPTGAEPLLRRTLFVFLPTSLLLVGDLQ